MNVTNDPIKTLKYWLRDSDYADFAQFTNINVSVFNARAISKAITKRNSRGWKETNGPEMKMFIGIIMYMGVHPIGSTECAGYWNRSRKTLWYLVIFETMGCIRFY
jgi:hypothetical protein